VSLDSPALDGSGMTVGVLEGEEKFAWVGRVAVCLDWDKCRAEVLYFVRHHVVPAGDVDDARVLQDFETSGPVELLPGVAAARKWVSCFAFLPRTGPWW
jgi:hypothetical protein